jgi:transcriptional regulator with XRE-family HTH domain
LSDSKKAKRVAKRNPRSTGSLDIHFGEKVKARRRMMTPKLSQADLANALGISFQQVQKYESGVNRMSAAATVQVAAALKVDVQYFFDELEQATTR